MTKKSNTDLLPGIDISNMDRVAILELLINIDSAQSILDKNRLEETTFRERVSVLTQSCGTKIDEAVYSPAEVYNFDFEAIAQEDNPNSDDKEDDSDDEDGDAGSDEAGD